MPVFISLLMPALRMTGAVFFVSALLLGAVFIYYAWRVLNVEGNKVAHQLYKYSSMYLMFIFVALVGVTVGAAYTQLVGGELSLAGESDKQ